MSDMPPTNAPAPSILRTLLVSFAIGCIPAIGVYFAYFIASTYQKDTVPGVTALLEEQEKCWNAGDLEGFMTGYQESEELTFYSGGTVNKGFKAVLERYRLRYQSEGKEMGKLTFSDLDVTPIGPRGAVARGRWKVVKSNETVDGLFTLMLRRFDGGWKIVHDHTSQSEPKK